MSKNYPNKKQTDYILEIAKHGLSNETDKLVQTLYDFVLYCQKTNRSSLASELLEIIKETGRNEELGKLREINHRTDIDNGYDDFILMKVMSSYTFENLICPESVSSELRSFIQERQMSNSLDSIGLRASNKILLHGPSGCGKTQSAYVLAGELKKPLFIINLGNVLSSELGETERILTYIFQRAQYENAIIFLDKLDTVGIQRNSLPCNEHMRSVVNTLLQLLAYLSNEIVVIAATNRIDTIDEELLRIFDLSVQFGYPDREQIAQFISHLLKDRFEFDNPQIKEEVISLCSKSNISYSSIKKSLLMAIKRTVLNQGIECRKIDSRLWLKLILEEIQQDDQ